MGRRRDSLPKPEDLAREQRVLDLRLAGLTFQRIADELNYATPSGAHGAYKRAMNRGFTEPVERLRKEQGHRLDQMLAGVWADAVQGDKDAISAVLRIEDRRAKLYGLDSPVRKEIAVLNVTAEVLDAEEARLRARLLELGVNVEALPPAEAYIQDIIDAEVVEGDESTDEPSEGGSE